MLSFTAYGVPIPQGSTKAFWRPGMKHAVVTADNRNTKPWRQAVVDASLELMAGREPLDCAVELWVVFFLPRPASAPRRVTEPSKLPDLDKLVRAVGDALTAAGVWKDDGRVVFTVARKAFAGGVHDPRGPAGVPRAEIQVREVGGLAPAVPTQPGLFEVPA